MPTAFLESDEWVEVRATSCPQDGKLSLKAFNHNLANDMRMWKRKGNTTTLSLSRKGLEILHPEKREQLNTEVMEHFNSIIFDKSEPANKQHTYQTIN